MRKGFGGVITSECRSTGRASETDGDDLSRCLTGLDIACEELTLGKASAGEYAVVVGAATLRRVRETFR